jgi:hypothetical protein
VGGFFFGEKERLYLRLNFNENIYKYVSLFISMKKRGQQLSITAVILIVLGIFVLIFLIIGVTVGWNKIMPWINPSNNVKSISDACKLACSTQTVYDFCTMKREVKLDKDTAEELELKVNIKATCEELSTDYPDLGIDNCLGLCPADGENAGN